MVENYQTTFPELEPDTVLAALTMLRQASLLMRELERYFAQHGLSQTRFLILILLDRELNQDGLLATDLVDKLDLSKPVVSKTVNALKAQGYIESRPCHHDGRASWLQLTPAGRQVLYDSLPEYYQLIQLFMQQQ